MTSTDISHLEQLALGKQVDYASEYQPDLLQGVARQLNRQHLPYTQLPFSGCDIWTGYELSWLNPKGKPQVAILECRVPADSPNIIESKSFKLYLNSFNQSHFKHIQTVQTLLQKDLSTCANARVNVTLYTPAQFAQLQMQEVSGNCIDDIDVEIQHYQPAPELLNTTEQQVAESLCSHLLKSNCLITNQPDWGSIQIDYRGKQIDHASLLKYLISFRLHNEFHEHCVERIFCDLMQQCQPDQLTVYARYTRRGGLDINPFRSNYAQPPANVRHARQ